MSDTPSLEECEAAGRGPTYNGNKYTEGGLPNTIEERQRFEAYMRGHCWSPGTYASEQGAYDTVLVRMLYGVWRDRAALDARQLERELTTLKAENAALTHRYKKLLRLAKATDRHCGCPACTAVSDFIEKEPK